MDLEGVTDELYGAPPERFTPRRDELAREAGAGGDKALAKAVRALRRPTAAAWVVNHLVREDPDEVEALVGLGERMREAQSTLSGAQMRSLSRERQSTLRELVGHAAALAGGSVSASVTAEVEQTLRAVLADEDAAAAVRSGCLTHGLAYSGLGPAGAGSTGRHLRAVPGPAGRTSSPGAGEVTRDSGDERDDGLTPAEREGREREAEEHESSERETAERRERRQELAEAESALRSSERAAEAATARAERARRRQQESEDDVVERERAWQAARERAAAAGAAAETASDQAAAAQAVAEAARQEVDRLRPLLDDS